ncbi:MULTISPECIES: HD domain-containing protein [Pseudodesulfovibrio]|uniref:Metal-dependent phosphohydrolase HD sub domain protein n=1 Tax=Pseudodesulfovibrio aespoeensis (strain ATCC 700646 / DSM 10631 / Aspo-2) TaxID=643562 RepID=E6VVB5_PSEA9|nr:MULTISPECIES: HD domain-containing protein [Pseudodesulfovibrio]ADU62359.1 metal-dependent phosphohydrolase HD sub domain protein [Pseudodesulfovibrio aespoeensis Aspo-2]MCG2734078.1 HD domain-containing protein [Pseudodesulfovibrio aespoeensis]
MQLGPHIAVLTGFAQRHLSGDAEGDKLINLKLEHSIQVLDTARHIIAGETITGRTADICLLAALYHDTGRFPQFARYQTFNDRESVNHARLGVLTLRSMTLPDGLSGEEWRIVRFAVAQHNAKTVRPTLPARLLHPVMVVRDADKLDIFRVLLDHFGENKKNPLVAMGLEDTSVQYSDEVYQAVLQGRTGDYRHMRFANDFKLLLAGWLHELHYPTTLAMAVEQRFPDRIFAMLPDDEPLRRLKDSVMSSIRYKF